MAIRRVLVLTVLLLTTSMLVRTAAPREVPSADSSDHVHSFLAGIGHKHSSSITEKIWEQKPVAGSPFTFCSSLLSNCGFLNLI